MNDMWLDDEQPQDEFSRPADRIAERIVAGSVMMRPDLIDELAADFEPADFTDQRYAWIWHAVDEIRTNLTDDKIPWHEVSLQLKKWQAEKYLPVVPFNDAELSQIYLEGEPSSAAWYAGRVNRMAERNRTLDLGMRAKTVALSPSFDRDRDLAALQQQLDAIIRSQAGNAPRTLNELLPDALERAVTPRTAENRIPTGLADLDVLTGGGFSPGRLVIIGARPGVGKTTVGQGFARAAAITNKIPTLFTSLEMGKDEILEGILAAECRVPMHHINTGTVSDADAVRLVNATSRLADAPLYIDDATDVSLPSLRGQVRNLVRTAGLRMVVVDYLQLMKAPKAESRQVAVAALSRGLKLMAKEFGITVVVLCQLNRASEQRSDKRPTIADLRESGAIEQDADMVILLHRPDMYEPESHRAGEADLIVDKHRGGQRSTITAAWQGHYARIFDMAYTPSSPVQQMEAA